MPQSYFALFNLEQRFTLSMADLEVAYRDLATRVHPDRHAQAQAVQQREALSLAANANEAYRTLRKPVLRARHLLALRGVHSDEGRAAMPHEFLVEQMEWRDALGDARTARDAAALRSLAATVHGRAAALLARLEMQMDILQDYSAARDTVHEFMFVEKLAADIDDSLAHLED